MGPRFMISISLCNKHLDYLDSIFLLISKIATGYVECEGGLLRLQ